MKYIKTFESVNQPISKDLKMIDEVVKDGIEAVKEYLEKTGYGMNCENGAILRLALRNDDYELAQYFVDNGGEVKLRRNMITKWASENANIKALQFLYDTGLRFDEREYNDVLNWVETSDKKTDEEKVEVFKFLPKFKI